MSGRFHFEEDKQWPMKIVRAIIWSAAMALCWGIPYCVLFGNPFPLPPAGPTEITTVLLAFAMPFMMGSVTGVCAALRATPEEKLFPLASPLFVQIGFRAAGISALGFIVMVFIRVFIRHWYPFFYSPFLLLIWCLAFVYGLFYAVSKHRADQESTVDELQAN